MANYLLTYYGGMGPENTTPAQRQKVMNEWMGWFQGMGMSVVEMGLPAKAGKMVGKGGARADGANHITGYSIIKADSLEKAVAMAKAGPSISSGTKIGVNELMQM